MKCSKSAGSIFCGGQGSNDWSERGAVVHAFSRVDSYGFLEVVVPTTSDFLMEWDKMRFADY
jgi:hypothetical protein